MPIEEAALAISRLAVKRAAAAWLQGRSASADRNSELVDLVAASIRDRFQRREFERQLERIADETARRLEDFVASDFRSTEKHELEAALTEATSCLRAADFSDAVLFAANLSPTQLSRQLLAASANSVGYTSLSDSGQVYYRVVVAECCQTIVTLVRRLPEFNQRGIVELLQRMTDIATMVERSPRLSTGALDQDAEDAEFNRLYAEQVVNKLDDLEIFCIDTRNYSPRISVTAAYLNLRVASHRDGFTGRQDQTGPAYASRLESAGASRVEHGLRTSSRLLVRGEAGSGKTTLLQWIAVNAARRSFSSSLAGWNGLIPLYVRLRSYADRSLPSIDALSDDIAGPISSLCPNGWVRRQLESNEAILLVDGVDELAPRQRPEVQVWLRGVLQSFPYLTVIVTSRPAAASSRWLSAQSFDNLDLESMTYQDVEDFCDRWHAAVTIAARSGAAELPCLPEEVQNYRTDLRKHLDVRPELRQVATSPLLCALICALNLNRRNNLPLDQMTLYRSAIDLLVDRRDRDRTIPFTGADTLTAESKVAILQRIAWRMVLLGRTELPIEDAEAHVALALRRWKGDTPDSATTLSFLLERSGVLRQPTIGKVDFIHRTFQDYLGGKEAAEDHYFEEVIESAHKDQWRDAVVMTAGHATNPNRERLIRGVLERADNEPRRSRRLRLLAGASLDACQLIDPQVVDAVEQGLAKLMPPRNRAEAASLARGGRSVLTQLPTTSEPLSTKVAEACIDTAALINGEGALGVLRRYASDERPEVQAALIAAWRYFEPKSYAERVLRSAPVDKGTVTVDLIEHAVLLPLLENVSSSIIRIAVEPTPETRIDFLRDVPRLTVYEGPGACCEDDLNVFQSHAESLESLELTLIQPREYLRSLEGLPNLLELHLRPRWGITSLRFIQRVEPTVTSFWIYNSGRVSDYSPLSHFKSLKDLTLFEAHGLKNLDFLPHECGLEEFWAPRSDLESGLHHLAPWESTLRDLVVSASSVNSLQPIESFSLNTLGVDNTAVADLRPLEGMATLRSLYLAGTAVTDLSPLASLPNLSFVDLHGYGSLNVNCFRGISNEMTLSVSDYTKIEGRETLPPNVRISAS